LPRRASARAAIPSISSSNKLRFATGLRTVGAFLLMQFSLRDLSLRSERRFRFESHDSACILMLDLAQVCVKKVEVAAEFSIELASRFASLFNDWVFHDQPSISS
jgi:hypothetical protein